MKNQSSKEFVLVARAVAFGRLFPRFPPDKERPRQGFWLRDRMLDVAMGVSGFSQPLSHLDLPAITILVRDSSAFPFLDRMIAPVEGATRKKTPNEIALSILLSGLTIVFQLAVVTLQPFAISPKAPQTVFVLVSLLVCLIPTTIGLPLSAIGIAGMVGDHESARSRR